MSAPPPPPDDAWLEPGAHAVAPGIHRIPLPLPGDGLRAVNVYAIESGGRLALVDAGWHRADSWEALRAGLRTLGADVGDVSHVLVTHVHHDHIGQAAELRRASGAVVVLGEGERRSLHAIIDPATRRRFLDDRFRQLERHGASPLAERIRAALDRTGGDGWPFDPDDWQRPDRFATDGERIELPGRSLRAVLTPGHTRGHLSFLDAGSAVLFAGDHVLPHITPSIGFEPFGGPLALVDFLCSLARVRQLPVDRVLPAHGPDFEGLAARVDALLAHHATRLSACVAAVGEGEPTAFDVAHQLAWTRRERRFTELDLYNRALAVRETTVHLELLAAQGTLVRREAGAMVRFRAALGERAGAGPRSDTFEHVTGAPTPRLEPDRR